MPEMHEMHAVGVRELHTGGDVGPPGSFRAVVSTFDAVVEQFTGPRVLRRGCFARSLEERGLPRLIWSHDWQRPPIGVTHSARETDEGLEVHATLNLDDDFARLVHWGMTTRNGDGRPLIDEFSIGFDVVAAEQQAAGDPDDPDAGERDGRRESRRDLTVITDVDLFEFGPCLVGANVTRLIEVAHALAPPGASGTDRPPGGDRTSRMVRDLLTARPR